MTDVYVAGSLHHMPREWWGIYERIGEAVERFGLSAVVPHIKTPEKINRTVETIVDSVNSQSDHDDFHKDIFMHDIEFVENAKLIIAEVSNPSLGSGIELGVALKAGKPIICLAGKGSRVTPLVIGAAQAGLLHLIRYDSVEDALEQLNVILKEKFSHLAHA